MPLYNKVTNRIEEHLKKESWHEYEVLDKLLEGNKWAAGDYVTLADFGLLATVSSFRVSLSKRFLKSFFKLNFCMLF